MVENIRFRLVIGCVVSFPFLFVRCYQKVDANQRARETITLRNNDKLHWMRKRATIQDGNEISKAELLRLQPGEGLKLLKTEQSSIGILTEKLQETYKDIPIFDGALTVEVTKDGILTGGATGTLIQNIDKDLSDVQPKLTKDKALDIAVKAEGDEDRRYDIGDVKIELWIYPWKDGKARLVYYVQYLIDINPPTRPTLIIDAQNGDILLRFNSIENFCCSESIVGYGGNEKQGKIEYGKDPYCIQPSRICLLENDYVRVEDMNDSENETSSQDTISYQCNIPLNDSENGGFSPSLDAFFYGTVVAKLYEEWTGETPLNEKIVLRVHYGKNLPTAMWNGKNCSFGDGGDDYYPLVFIDVIGHEIGHGVVEQNSNLFYFGQSGGINEAFADILGETAVAFLSDSEVDWNIGTEITRKKPYERSFENPELDGSIAHIDNYTILMRPHHLSGPFRFAYYSIVAMYNVSFKNAFRVFDRANKLYWHHMSTYQQAGCDVIKAAYDLGQDVLVFEKSFEAIGVRNCSTLENIPYLTFNREKNGIKVSKDSKPVFKIRTPLWTVNMTVTTESLKGNIKICVSDQYYLLSSQNCTILGTNNITFEPDDDVDLYIGLSSKTKDITDVGLTVSYECVKFWKMKDNSTDSLMMFYLHRRHCKN